ncbi:hypothetical protein CBL_08429 [Carabus blaptoides fortunei]
MATGITELRKGGCNRVEVNQIPVIALYDVPHLFKGLRNHFVKKNIVCTLDGKKLTGDWQHIADCYAIDQQEEVGSLRLCPNLTDRHINLLQSSYKIKVKYCTQVLSRRVAAMINYFAKKNDICAAAKQTALIILFLDQLFDSLNSSSRDGTEGKLLTSALRAHSDHWKFWRIACKVLHTMEFLDKIDGKKSYPPSLKNFSVTIRGIQEIFKVAQKEGAQYLCLRNFNEDPLENFFGIIRSHGARNISPSCSAFTAAVSVEETVQETYEDPELVDIADDHVELSNYCSGFVIKSLKKITKNCVLCKSELEALREGPQHAVISAREYTTDVDRLV